MDDQTRREIAAIRATLARHEAELTALRARVKEVEDTFRAIAALLPATIRRDACPPMTT